MSRVLHASRSALAGVALCALAAASIFGLAGCVTEKRTGFRPPPKQEPVQLPPGPIAQPAPANSTTSSRVEVQLAPLGNVHYDGQVLPLVSPDGRFLAVEDREAPGWPALLAQVGALPPVGTRLAAYDATSPPLKRIEWPQALPPGVLLGRSADSRGFLVEMVRPDGARWIGRVEWLTGRLEWLAQGDQVNAHGVLTAQGWLVYTRRDKLNDAAALVVRMPDGSEISSAAEAGTYAFPLASDEPDVVYALRSAGDLLELEAVHVLVEPGHPARFGSAFAQGLLARGTDPALAYEVVIPLQGALAKPSTETTPTSDGASGAAPEFGFEPLVVFHPQMQKMALFDPRTGSFAPLAPRSISAVRWDAPGAPGYLCTTPGGLVFFPMPTLPGDVTERPSLGREVRVLAKSYVPRVTLDPQRPVILFGPAGRDPEVLEVLSMRRAEVPAPSP